jgi:hypothetical protein
MSATEKKPAPLGKYSPVRVHASLPLTYHPVPAIA